MPQGFQHWILVFKALELIRIPVGGWYSPHSPLRDSPPQLRKPSPEAQRLWEGLDVPRAPGPVLVGGAPAEPNFPGGAQLR